MIKVINLPKETLETIKNLQIEFIKVMNQIGEVRIEMNNLSELEKKLFIDYKELKNREKQLERIVLNTNHFIDMMYIKQGFDWGEFLQYDLFRYFCDCVRA